MGAVKTLLLFALVSFLSLAKAADGEVRTLWFKADLAVDAEGSPVIGPIEGVSGNLADLVRQQLARMPYVPAQFEGTPVASSAMIKGRLVLTPVEGGKFDVRLDRVAVGPVPVRRAPIMYPPSQARARAAGYAEVLVTVDHAGKVSEVAILASSHKSFGEAVSSAIGRWQFAPVSPAPIQVPITAVFHPANQQPPDVEFECRLDPARLHVRGQNGCIEQLTVTGEVVRR